MESRKAPTKKLAEKWRRPSVSDDVTVCKICSKAFVNPRTLPCMHSFCEDCLLVLLDCYERQGKLDRTFFCPTCQVRVPCHILGPVSRDWLRMFPQKQNIDKMKEAILVVEEMCSPCSMSWKITAATEFCVDCQHYMCSACHTDHQSNSQMKSHKTVAYVVKEMKTTPVSNISKFNCKAHNSLRFTSFCEIHQVFLCNTCRETAVHRNCRVTNRVIEATGNITKAETKLNLINTLKRNERGKGKQLLKLIEQIDGMQATLERCRKRQVQLYCNYVMQATITEQKTEAIDALKGKLEFVKHHQPHDIVNATIGKVEDILTRYVDLFPELADAEEKASNIEMHKGIVEIEKVLKRPAFASFEVKEENQTRKDSVQKTSKPPKAVDIPKETGQDKASYKLSNFTTDQPFHVCKRHVDDTLNQETFMRLGSHFQSVGAICYKTMSATAFRVGSIYVMTAATTVRDIVDPDRGGDSDWSAFEGADVFLTFDSPMTSQTNKFRLCSQVSFLDDDLNVAVLEVQNSDHPLPPPVTLSRKNLASVGVGEVAIIGYGHQGSHSKHIDVKCGIVAPDSDRAKQALDWIKSEERKQRCNLYASRKDVSSVNWHYDEMKNPAIVAIDCCMEYRALGAPVFTNTGESGAEVLGIIARSVPDCFTEMPRATQERYKAYRFEIATKTSIVYEKLALETRFLADDIFIKDKNYYDYSKYEHETSIGTPDAMMTSSSTRTSSQMMETPSQFSDT